MRESMTHTEEESARDYDGVCDNCLTAAYDADTCPEKRGRDWQADFCMRHGDILEDHTCMTFCACACGEVIA